ncbi:MAG: hypothetical protein Q6352_002750 [Candidatus Freyrarchaeum guaymaensis]
MKYVGVDVHKKFCRVCVKDRDGIILDEFSIPNDRGGFTCLLDAVGGGEAKAVTGEHRQLLDPPLHRPRGGGCGGGAREPQEDQGHSRGQAEEPGKVDARTLADLLRADLVAPSRRSTQRDKGIEKPDKTPNEPRRGQNQAEEPRPRPPRDRYKP